MVAQSPDVQEKTGLDESKEPLTGTVTYISLMQPVKHAISDNSTEV